MYVIAPTKPTGKVHATEVPTAFFIVSPISLRNGPIKIPPPMAKVVDTVPTNDPKGTVMKELISLDVALSLILKNILRETNKIKKANIFLKSSFSAFTEIKAPITPPRQIPNNNLVKFLQDTFLFALCTGIADIELNTIQLKAVPNDKGILTSSE